MWIARTKGINQLRLIGVDVSFSRDPVDESRGEIEMKVAYLSLAFQMPGMCYTCGQNDKATSPQVSLTPDDSFVEPGRRCKVDDKDMTINGRHIKIIEGMHDLRDVNPLPIFSPARLDDMLRWNVKRGFFYATF